MKCLTRQSLNSSWNSSWNPAILCLTLSQLTSKTDCLVMFLKNTQDENQPNMEITGFCGFKAQIFSRRLWGCSSECFWYSEVIGICAEHKLPKLAASHCSHLWASFCPSAYGSHTGRVLNNRWSVANSRICVEPLACILSVRDLKHLTSVCNPLILLLKNQLPSPPHQGHTPYSAPCWDWVGPARLLFTLLTLLVTFSIPVLSTGSLLSVIDLPWPVESEAS